MRMAFAGGYRYRANPLLLAKRKYLEWRSDNRDFARAKANARHHYGLPFEFFRLVLGDDCLYAEAYWPAGTTTVADAQRQFAGMRPMNVRHEHPFGGFAVSLATLGCIPAAPAGCRCPIEKSQFLPDRNVTASGG